jgi:inner membrane transporter RhtA
VKSPITVPVLEPPRAPAGVPRRRATFALMLGIPPVTAALVDLVVPAQRPAIPDRAGTALITAGVALHPQSSQEEAP